MTGSLAGCSGRVFLHSEWTQKKPRKLPVFKNIEIKSDDYKTIIVLYRPFWLRREPVSWRFHNIILFDNQRITNDLEMGLFTVLRLWPGKVIFSTIREGENEKWSRASLRKFEFDLESGKKYFLRWSENSPKYHKNSFTIFRTFQLVDEKTALEELKDIYYVAPLRHKAAVFDKKTGKAL